MHFRDLPEGAALIGLGHLATTANGQAHLLTVVNCRVVKQKVPSAVRRGWEERICYGKGPLYIVSFWTAGEHGRASFSQKIELLRPYVKQPVSIVVCPDNVSAAAIVWQGDPPELDPDMLRNIRRATTLALQIPR